MALNQRLQIDWNGDGLYANANSDVTSDVVASVRCRRGRDYETQVYGRSVAGRLTATLRNDTGKYDRFAENSDLRNLVIPRRQVRFGTFDDGADTFTGVIVRATLTAGSELWPRDGTVAAGGDLQINNTLAVGRLVWIGNGQLRIHRSSGSINSLATAFTTGVAAGKSLYFVIGYDHIEIPSTLYSSGGTAFVRYNIPNTAPWADERAFLDGIGSGDEYEFIIADAGGGPGAQAFVPFWVGYLDDIENQERRSGQDEVRITALGILSEVTQRRVSSQMYTDVTTGEAAQHVVDALGIPDDAVGDLDGDTEMARWWAGNQLGIEALRQVEETEGGILYEARNGQLTMDASDARITGSRREAVGIFADDDTVDAIPLLTAVAQDPVKDVANVVRVRVHNYSVGSEATLWSLPMAVELGSGEELRFIAEYPDGVGSWVTPLVASADYEAFDSEDGTGTDRTSDITITATERGAEIVLDVENGHTGAVWVTTLGVRGHALTEGQSVTIERRNADSVTVYEAQTYLSPALFLGSVPEAKTYADFILSLLAQPQRRATVSWDASYAEDLVRTLEISDRVSLVTRNAEASMFMESIEHRFDRGERHIVTMLLSPAELFSQVCIWDVGPGFDEGIWGR